MDETLIGYLLDALDRDGRRAVERTSASTPRPAPVCRCCGGCWSRWPTTATIPSRRPAWPTAPSRMSPTSGRTSVCRAPRRRRGVRSGRRRGAARDASIWSWPCWRCAHRGAVHVVAGPAVARLSGTRLSEQFAPVLGGVAGVRRRPARRRVSAREAAPPRNFAGVFVPVLADAGALGSDVTVSCPARGRKPRRPVPLPTLRRWCAADPTTFRR